MDFPIKNGGSFHSFFVCLPEGKPYKSHGAWNCDFALENVPDLFIRSTPISQAKSSESHHLADAFCRALVERQDIEKKSMLENNPYNLCDFIIFFTWISMIYIYIWYMMIYGLLIHIDSWLFTFHSHGGISPMKIRSSGCVQSVREAQR